MENDILTVGTMSRAIRARRLLSAARIPARLVKTTDDRAGGCRYGLELDPRDTAEAMRLLDRDGIGYTRGRAPGRRRP